MSSYQRFIYTIGLLAAQQALAPPASNQSRQAKAALDVLIVVFDDCQHARVDDDSVYSARFRDLVTDTQTSIDFHRSQARHLAGNAARQNETVLQAYLTLATALDTALALDQVTVSA